MPADAVLDSGHGEDNFPGPRQRLLRTAAQVETGERLDDRVEIVKGLSPGERIVTSGAFLLNSESQLKPAATGGLRP